VATSAFSLSQNVAFCTIPDSSRQLLCDIWQPAKQIKRSGLAFIYFHGSAWTVLDKDLGTRPLFSHLVAQGHVVMDVAYRLFPETDITGMVQDVYRAIAWMKRNSAIYGIDPDSIVIGGGSAGAHLSLLAAYSSHLLAFVPVELQHSDLRVKAVISEYGPVDLKAMYYHMGQQHTSQPRVTNSTKEKIASMPQWVQNMMGANYHRLGLDKDAAQIGMLPVILGCRAEECSEVYSHFSPVSHVHRGCPPTLILQGTHDIITPASAAQQLYNRLIEAAVPTALFLIPQTDHAFDLVLPRISPVAHTAVYVIERFLALQLQDVTFHPLTGVDSQG
jgi:acetyl esterase/lipase